jgi:hypothetical protein
MGRRILPDDSHAAYLNCTKDHDHAFLKSCALRERNVRRAGDQIRATAQLIDAETDAHLWAVCFDRGTGDLFALQNEITSRIAIELGFPLNAEHPRRDRSPPRRSHGFNYRRAKLLFRVSAETMAAP